MPRRKPPHSRYARLNILGNSIRSDSSEARTAPARVHEHIKPLDGLRGVAIVLVIVPHLASAGMIPGPAALQQLIATLAHGVDLFFVLSGFGLAYPLIEQRLAGRAPRLDMLTYAFNRIYRILPPFYIAIAFTYVIAHIAQATGRLKPNELLFVPHTLYQMLAPLLLLDRANLPINPNLWTIAIQMRWYVVFPVLLFVWMKSPRAFGVLLGCAWIGYLFTRARTIDLGTLPLFMLGIVAADLIARRHRVVRFAVVLVPVAIVAALAWDPHAMVQDPWQSEAHFLSQPTSFPWQIAAFALAVAGATLRPLRAVLSFPPLVALGKASFSIYLVHQPVIALVLAEAGRRAGAPALIAVLVAGFAFWWCIERQLTGSQRRRRIRERALPAIKRVFSGLGFPRTIVYAAAPGSADVVRIS